MRLPTNYRKSLSRRGTAVGANQIKEAYADAKRQIQTAFARGWYRGKTKLNVGANAQQLDWDEWEARDDDPITEARVAKGAADDLIDAGLARDESLATMYSRWSIQSEAGKAQRSMDARNRSAGDIPEKAHDSVAKPITHVDYEISFREMLASQQQGRDLAAEQAEEAGETLAVAQEQLMFNGWRVNVPSRNTGDTTVPGYTTFEDRITGTAPDAWRDVDGNTQANVVQDTIDAMQQDLHGQTTDENRGANVEEGAVLYYPRARWRDVTLAAEGRGDGDRTIADRIESDYPWLTLRQSGVLDSDEIVMSVMDRKFIDLVNAQPATTMSWDIEGGVSTGYKAMNCQIPRLKKTFGPDDEDPIVGVAHYTGLDA